VRKKVLEGEKRAKYCLNYGDYPSKPNNITHNLDAVGTFLLMKLTLILLS
jgi:hypothetical protein